MRMTVAFYDCTQVYLFRTTNGSLAVISMGDLYDPFDPLPSDILFHPLKDTEDYLDSLLNWLEGITVKNTTAAVGSALATAIKIQSDLGRVILFSQSAVSSGLGALTKDVHYDKIYSTEHESTLYEQKNGYLGTLSKEYLSKNVALDIFYVHRNNYLVDFPSLALIAAKTNGFLYKYTHDTSFETALFHDLDKLLNTVFFYGITVVPRCSYQIEPTTIYSVSGRSPSTASYPSFESTSNIMVEFQLNETLQETSAYHFQFAILYTNEDLQSFIRVLNYKAEAAKLTEVVYDSADFEVASKYWFMRLFHENKLTATVMTTKVKELILKVLIYYRTHVLS